MRRSLAEIMRATDILCVAARNQTKLPSILTSWLTKAEPSGVTRPLLALLDISHPAANESGPSPATSFLEAYARTHRMEYLPYYTADLGPHLLPASEIPLASRAYNPEYFRRYGSYPAEVSGLNE